MKEENGAIHILIAGLVVIGLVIALIVAVLSGLDRATQEDSAQSLFSEDAKITPILEDLRERKNELLDRAAEFRQKDQADKSVGADEGPKSVDERLNALEGRLESPPGK